MALPSTAVMGTGLRFSGMTDLGVSFGLNLQYTVMDKSWTVYLCVGEEGNRVAITGTNPASRQAAVLAAIDTYGKWAQNIPLWMVAEKNGTITARTPRVNYWTHVKPFYGILTISAIAADTPAMTYAGSGLGRLLSKPINNRYYFIYGGRLETNDQLRGLDCTSFPMALLSVPSIAQPAYGKQLCDALKATPCDLEQVKSQALKKQFTDDTIPAGLYVVFSAGHVMLYDSDQNILHEFNTTNADHKKSQPKGYYTWSPAGSRALAAPQDLWWVRKIDEKYRPNYA